MKRIRYKQIFSISIFATIAIFFLGMALNSWMVWAVGCGISGFICLWAGSIFVNSYELGYEDEVKKR